jgi:hypothetical protein
MGNNIQRSRGRPQNYQFDRGGMPAEFGPFIGVVKNNIDPTRSGRLQVYIEQFAGDDPEDKTLWRTVNYVPPFYGVTPRNNATGSGGDGTYKGNQQSYGMWFTPPDIGVQVICFFVAGDPNQGYYIGCIPDPGVTHMIPAIGASRKFTAKNQQQSSEIAAAEAEQMPVVEINQDNPAVNDNPRFFDQPKPVHDYVYSILYNQGLLGDYIRGPISSSAQRESPSAVYGISTPGRPIYQGGLSERDIKAKVQSGSLSLDDVKVEGRRGGHSLVMDDGDLQGRDNLIRIRTAKGHQITMSDEADCFYFIHANGQIWIELGSEGTLDVYSTNSVNIRTQGEINLHADKNININAKENLNIRAGNIKIESQNTTEFSSTSDFTLHSKTKLGLVSDDLIALDAARGGWRNSGALSLKGSRIDLNGGSAPESVTKPKPLQEYSLDDTKLEPGKGWQVQPGKLETIVQRAPTHEPYPYHNRGVPVEIELVAEAPAPLSPAVANTLASTADVPVQAPPTAVLETPAATATTPTTPSVASATTLAQSSVASATRAVGVDAASVLKTPVADIKVGNLSKADVTGLLAQAQSAVGQASSEISVDKGLGSFGLQPAQLESAGFLKPGTLSQLQSGPVPAVTEADIAEATKINGEGRDITPEQVAQNRKINSVLSSPMMWTGKAGVGDLDNLLSNPGLQNAAQQSLMASSLEGLKSSGLATGKETAQSLGPLVQTATTAGVAALGSLVKGTASPDAAAKLVGTIKGAQFATDFMEKNASQLGSLSRKAQAAANTVDRTQLDAQVKAALGDPKIPAPEFKPAEREPDVPTVESNLRDEARAIVLEIANFFNEVKVLADAAIAESARLDAQQPLTAAQIDAFAAMRDEWRSLYNNRLDDNRVKLEELGSTKYDPIREIVNDQVASLNRLSRLLRGISEAQKELIAQWRANAAVANT